VTSHRSRVVAVFLTAAVAVGTHAGAASAHVEVSPDEVAPGAFTTFRFTVPNETVDQDTIAVDVEVPAGFTVDSAQALPGWTTVVDSAPDGTITRLHWRSGHLAPHTFAEFAVRARAPRHPGPLAFELTQRYERSVVRWSGPVDAARPAPVLTVAANADPEGLGASTGASATVPPAPGPLAGVRDTEDPLARSRADLALALSLSGLVGAAGAAALLLARRHAKRTR
jgi:uncharacterized protein YcnI